MAAEEASVSKQIIDSASMPMIVGVPVEWFGRTKTGRGICLFSLLRYTKLVSAWAHTRLLQLEHVFLLLDIPGNHEIAFTENRERPLIILDGNNEKGLNSYAPTHPS
jgi:hypothetical protein